MDFQTWFLKDNSGIQPFSIDAVLRLHTEGSTIPFIARYRKEQTGNLDETQIQKIIDEKEEWDDIVKRQEFIKGEIEKHPKLSDSEKTEIIAKISATFTKNELEDIYLPHRIKKKSKATKAKEAGLEPLADWIWNCGHAKETPQEGQTLDIWAFTFVNEKNGIPDAQTAIDGATDILIERLSETKILREFVRNLLFNEGFLRSEKGEKAKENSKYEKYFGFQENIQSLLKPENTHRYLAIRRGWIEEELKMVLDGPDFESSMLSAFEAEACNVPEFSGAEVLKKAAKVAFKAHVLPSIENEVQHALRKVADEAAIKVFSENVRKLLMGSPLGSKAVVGVDPGIRTGCKVAVVDDSGKFLASSVFFFENDEQKATAKNIFKTIFENLKISAIAVGNGTHGREAESFLRKAFKESELVELSKDIPIVMVNEAGASVYSASAAARDEFPELDVTVRGAISIARRLQDPLAELVKIDPKSIGVGQYQHDVSQHALKRSLEYVVDSCVNQVGVNLNTASHHLLSHVSGIGESLAKSIVEFREKNGIIKSRQDLLNISRFSQKTFEQAAGFLRIPESDNPLDNTGVHPEKYSILEKFAEKLSKSIKDLIGAGADLLNQFEEIKSDLGEFTFKDVIEELKKPGRDPRDPFVVFQFRDDIHSLADLKKDMICPGIVTNVTNFGAFVDIGVHQDGLVHLSQLADKFVKDPREIVNPGDRVQVKVIEINLDKKQIALSMRGLNKKIAAPQFSRKFKDETRDQNRPQNRPQNNAQNKKRDYQRDERPRRQERFENQFSPPVEKRAPLRGSEIEADRLMREMARGGKPNRFDKNSKPGFKGNQNSRPDRPRANDNRSEKPRNFDRKSDNRQPRQSMDKPKDGFNTPFASLANLLKKD